MASFSVFAVIFTHVYVYTYIFLNMHCSVWLVARYKWQELSSEVVDKGSLGSYARNDQECREQGGKAELSHQQKPDLQPQLNLSSQKMASSVSFYILALRSSISVILLQTFPWEQEGVSSWRLVILNVSEMHSPDSHSSSGGNQGKWRPGRHLPMRF